MPQEKQEADSAGRAKDQPDAELADLPAPKVDPAAEAAVKGGRRRTDWTVGHVTDPKLSDLG